MPPCPLSCNMDSFNWAPTHFSKYHSSILISPIYVGLESDSFLASVEIIRIEPSPWGKSR
ncbi:hypothetical protein ES332_A12G197500v1 [Gossypium tomentosum]|uniref:Uncharacterized protein n=1 Tax=Gossypium tomentosum TaxID=34277 RepID=A0A5D2MZL8_GOSTO|nr:hypothetical protein ES332_A12G197500v1 [Gossypium tomentosum]